MTDPLLRYGVEGRTDLADLKPYRAPQLDAAVKLNTNESPYPPPESFTKELQDRVAGLALNRYPVRDFLEVREALAADLGTLTDRVWLANGSNEIILQLLLAYGGAERKVMTFEPTYEMHGHITRVTGTRHLRARRNPNYSMDLDASIDAIQTYRPDIVFLCSPNNPTGNSNPAEDIIAICERTPALIILDEAYVEFSGRSHLRLVEEFENLVICRTFSKAWRLAGIRVGYLVAQPAIHEEVQKVRLPYHLSSLTQAAALSALNHSAEIKGTIETLMYERDRVYRELSTMRGINAFPSDANFILFRCESRLAGRDVAGPARPGGPGAQLLRHAGLRGVPAGNDRHQRAERAVPGDALQAHLSQTRPHAGMSRVGEVTRETRETSIKLRLDLDGTGKTNIATGVGFFDHMLDQLGRHALIDLEVQAVGDLQVDSHHTVEDVGICLGTALTQALGEKKGIRRYGWAIVPMEEALVQVALDLSGRPLLAYDAPVPSEAIGNYDPELDRGVLHGVLPHGRDDAAHQAAGGQELAPHNRGSVQSGLAGAGGGDRGRPAPGRRGPFDQGCSMKTGGWSYGAGLCERPPVRGVK